ncbi:MAG: FAD-dependent oxidoreductase [Oscillospiraceae bacterium]|nr:FAD-dependent oxidoreductase [Oscillospiraceae bacterium]
MYDIIVVGAGPAGMTAALYACRAGKSVLILEKETFGGQITYSPKVENYPGIAQMSGSFFADQLLEQVLAMGAEVEMETVTGVKAVPQGYAVLTDGGEFDCRAVILATGSRHRQLGLPHENELVGEGVSYCAVCDGAFYAGKNVAVIGGGNTALQEAVLLSETCAHVTLVQNLPVFTGEEKLLEILRAKDNVSFLTETVVAELQGETALEAITLDKNGEKSTLTVDGIFVAIGQVPENEPFASLVPLTAQGYFDCGEDCVSETAGVFVAGDCRRKTVRQITTATADGASAALAACKYVDAL